MSGKDRSLNLISCVLLILLETLTINLEYRSQRIQSSRKGLLLNKSRLLGHALLLPQAEAVGIHRFLG